MTDAERIDRIERIVLVLTRDYVDQFSGDAEQELARLVDELRAEHPGVYRDGAFLKLAPDTSTVDA